MNKIYVRINDKKINITDYIKMIPGDFKGNFVPVGYTKIKFDDLEIELKGNY